MWNVESFYIPIIIYNNITGAISLLLLRTWCVVSWLKISDCIFAFCIIVIIIFIIIHISPTVVEVRSEKTSTKKKKKKVDQHLSLSLSSFFQVKSRAKDTPYTLMFSSCVAHSSNQDKRLQTTSH